MSAVEQELKSIVEKHTVRYEAWPHWEMHEDRRVMVGFDLELYGSYEHGHSQPIPNSEIYSDLKKVADEILPKDERPSSYRIQPFDHALHSEGRGPSEVVLVISIQHRRDYFSPVDACEERCLAEMESSLKQLGIPGRRRR